LTIVVTGVAGFIGSQLARALLARGDRVLGIDNLNDYYPVQLKRDRLSDIAHPHFAFHEVDFADHVALDAALSGVAVDSIVHLGAQAGVRYSLINPRAYVQSNLAGHLNLLEVARHHGVRQMIYASSSSVYGSNKNLPFRVTDRVDHPISLYAATKKADELMSETYAHLYRIPLTGLRFFTVYGRWGRPDMAVWSFAERILTGQPIPVFNKGEMRRDFTHIDDIVAGIVAALDHPVCDDGVEKPGGSHAPHRLYNIGNNRAEDLMRLISVLEAACGRRAAIDFQPMQPGDVVETYADITDLTRDLGFAPTTPIDIGVPDFVQWLKAYRGL
jgi:UDP-glucuronate 4-epimerase